MTRSIKTVVFWVILGISAILLWEVVRAAPADRSPEISYTQFLSDAEAGSVSAVTISGARIEGVYRNGKGTFHLVGPSSASYYLDTLRAKGVEIRFRETESSSLGLTLLGTWAPLIMLGVLWFYMIRQMQRIRSAKAGEALQGSGSLGPPSNPAL